MSNLLSKFVTTFVATAPDTIPAMVKALNLFSQQENIDLSTLIKEIQTDRHLAIDDEMDEVIDAKFPKQ